MADEKKFVQTPSPPQRDNTLAIRLADPKIDQITFNSASLKLHTMRQYLSAFSIKEDRDRSGMDFAVFLRHALGMKTLTLEGVKLEFIKTTKGIYLIYEEDAATGNGQAGGAAAILGKAVPGLPLERRYLLSDGKEEAVMLRFTGSEFGMIEKAAKEYVDVEALRQKLAGSVALESDESFEVKAFAAGIRAASSYRDELDRVHYIIDHADGSTYTVYTRRDPKERAENPLLYSGTAGSEIFCVYLVEVIG